MTENIESKSPAPVRLGYLLSVLPAMVLGAALGIAVYWIVSPAHENSSSAGAGAALGGKPPPPPSGPARCTPRSPCPVQARAPSAAWT